MRSTGRGITAALAESSDTKRMKGGWASRDILYLTDLIGQQIKSTNLFASALFCSFLVDERLFTSYRIAASMVCVPAKPFSRDTAKYT